MPTQYRLASSPRDYARCHALLRREQGSDTPLQFPTVMAMEGESLVGFLGTHPSADAVVAGPLVMPRDYRSVFRWKRFVEAYENVLLAAGVRIYLFSISEADDTYCKAVRELGATVFAKRDGEIIFKRDMRAPDVRAEAA